MKIITLSGTDGSGKSTHANFLQEYLESQGEKVYRFHAIDFSFANKLTKNASAHKKSPANTQGNFCTTLLRKFLLLIDILRFRLLLRKLRKKYDILLSDRYFYDTVLNIYYLRGGETFLCSASLIPKPDLALFLDVSPESIMRRHHTPEQGLEYLKQKHALFTKHIDIWNMHVINADDTKENVFLRVKSLAEK